jgi:hypothetical protein
MSTKTDRRGFFARLLGGAAAAVVAPEVVKAAPVMLPKVDVTAIMLADAQALNLAYFQHFKGYEYRGNNNPTFAGVFSAIQDGTGKIVIHEYKP